MFRKPKGPRWTLRPVSIALAAFCCWGMGVEALPDEIERVLEDNAAIMAPPSEYRYSATVTSIRIDDELATSRELITLFKVKRDGGYFSSESRKYGIAQYKDTSPFNTVVLRTPETIYLRKDDDFSTGLQRGITEAYPVTELDVPGSRAHFLFNMWTSDAFASSVGLDQVTTLRRFCANWEASGGTLKLSSEDSQAEGPVIEAWSSGHTVPSAIIRFRSTQNGCLLTMVEFYDSEGSLTSDRSIEYDQVSGFHVPVQEKEIRYAFSADPRMPRVTEENTRVLDQFHLGLSENDVGSNWLGDMGITEGSLVGRVDASPEGNVIVRNLKFTEGLLKEDE